MGKLLQRIFHFRDNQFKWLYMFFHCSHIHTNSQETNVFFEDAVRMKGKSGPIDHRYLIVRKITRYYRDNVNRVKCQVAGEFMAPGPMVGCVVFQVGA